MNYPYRFFQVSMFALLAFGLLACNKYPNGPSFSVKTATKRVATTWKVKEAARNNQDLTADFEGDYFTFEADGSFETLDAARSIVLPPFTQNVSVPIMGRGEWNFADDQKKIEVLYTATYTDPYNPDVSYSEDVNKVWDVFRLADGELWLQEGDLFLKLIFFEE